MVKVHKTIVFVVLGLLFNLSVKGQADRYAVFLADKNNTPYSVDLPENFLSAKALQRRVDQNIVITAEDLPVDPVYIENVRSTGVEVLHASKWFNALIIVAQTSAIATIEALPFVIRVEKIASGDRPVFNSRRADPNSNGRTQTSINGAQLLQLGLNNLHNEGYTGAGITVAFFDSGYRGVNTIGAFQHIINSGRLIHTHNLPENNTDVFLSDDHGTESFSIVAGFLEGAFTGAAYDADFALFITEDVGTEYPIEEYNWLVAAEKADSLGADVISSSLGYNTFDAPFDSYEYMDMDGNTTVVSRAADIASSKGILVVTSAGNEGNNSWQFITAPADADSVVSVGSVDFSGTISPFSSFGPTFDGRTKPEVVAVGQGTYRINQVGSIVQAPSGTSVSAPMITGLAACLWQSRPAFTNIQLRDTLLSISDRFNNPDNRYGYGIPKYGNITSLPEPGRPEGPILAYPNPYQGNAFRIVNLLTFLVEELYVFDITGKQLGNYQWKYADEDENEIIVLTRSLAPGTYIIQLKSTFDSKQIKILKR